MIVRHAPRAVKAAVSLPRAPRWVTMFAVTALVAGPPFQYLRYHHYPLLSPEVLWPAALVVVMTSAMGIGLNRASRSIRIAGFSLLLLLFLDMQFSFRVYWPEPVFLGVGLAGIAAGVWVFEGRLETIVAASLAAFYVAGVPETSAIKSSSLNFPNVRADTTLPPVVYLILDEHIGVEGWPMEISSAREMQRRIRDFYRGDGFRLFGRAYSEFARTTSSIPAVLNWPVPDPRDDVTEIVPWQRYRLTSNKMFQTLSARGYRIRIYQSTYLDYCNARAYAIRSCDTSPANSISNISLLHLPVWSKTVLVGLYFLEHRSRIYGELAGLLPSYEESARSGEPPVRWEREEQSTFQAAMRLLDRLRQDLRADDPRGTVYFAHLLAPHFPYVVDSACRPRRLPSLQLEQVPAVGFRVASKATERAERYELYAGQVGCLYRQLEALLRLVDSTRTGRQTVVIIHGDHGSRIALHGPLPRNVANLDPSDFLDAFATLFAIRAPAIPPGYDRSFLPIDALVGRAVESRFARVDGTDTEPHFVRLESGFTTPYVTVRLADTALVPLHGRAAPTTLPSPNFRAAPR